MAGGTPVDEGKEAARALIEEIALADLRALADDDEFLEELAEEFRRIQELENARPEGDALIVLGGRSISISEATWGLLKAAGGLALLAVGPEPITKAAGGGLLIEAVYNCRNVIKKLDATDQAVCAAVTEQRRRNKKRQTDVRVTKAEIESYFKEMREDVPVMLDEILDELVNNKAVLQRERENDVEYYRIKF